MSRAVTTLLSAAGQAVATLDAQLSDAISGATTPKSGVGAAGATSSVVVGKVASLVDDAVAHSSLNLDAALRPERGRLHVLKYVNQRYDTIAALNSIGMMESDRHRPPQFRHETVALNALGLLDMLVKNCGYPFHLIIASKEFLNELVKRFPEKPTTGNVIQIRILELIQQWNSTLCVHSRYREDFKHITDMYRLLSYKGTSGRHKSAQSRIQSLISNGEQEERMERLLLINDYINTTLENYTKFRTGQSFSKPHLPSPQNSHPPASSPVVSPATGAISLIDFDDTTIPASSPFSVGNFQIPATTTSGPSSVPPPSGPSGLGDLKDLDFFGSSARVQQPLQQPTLLGGSNLGGFGGLNAIPVMGPGFGTPLAALQKPLTTSPSFGGAPPLTAAPIGGILPPQAQQPQPVLSSVNLLNQSLDMSFGKNTGTPVNTPVVAAAPPSLISPLQNLSLSSEPKDVKLFNKNGLQIKLKYTRDSPTSIQATATFINTTPVSFEQLVFQVAVPKAMQLTMQPLSGTTVPPLNQAQVTQALKIVNPTSCTDQVNMQDALKIRFKVSYDLNGADVEESGEYVFQ
ncbi:VHS-domain-containing protein [Rhizoclosmatium globosum]|uniref:VHS-domain-containing protein n=1 Tax=Rhizoclosmatium globosum TaxID=329046 RepID=A0A1Y2CK29_9FUNG|nr:VHS-domain-containing protein [Rhizoclosmatium globosum]|eukprot:ORY47350.1 VHS-domain-containing protein [Rhizoclosmatium globosum]